MFKKTSSFVLVVLLLNVVGVNSAYAVPKDEKEARFAKQVKERIGKLGTGTQARVEVKLRDKTKLKGYVSQINENSFVIVEDNTQKATEVPYQNVKQVKGKNLSTGVKIVIGVAFAAALLFVTSYLILYIDAKT